MLTKQPQGRLKTSEQLMSCHEMLCFFFSSRKKTVITDACHAVESSTHSAEAVSCSLPSTHLFPPEAKVKPYGFSSFFADTLRL